MWILELQSEKNSGETNEVQSKKQTKSSAKKNKGWCNESYSIKWLKSLDFLYIKAAYCENKYVK